ncbi:PstA family ABC transporter permease [Muricomes intestini]|uniref:PstA family ABC transporter permease n=1 Tax=Muricomes intestini TaxID=1796634 RepID=UPI002FE42109
MRHRVGKYLTRLACFLLGVSAIGIALFLFVYVFWKGRGVISLSFLLDSPSGVPVGTDGGIFPALIGSIFLGGLSALMGGLLGIGAALYLAFYSDRKWFSVLVNTAILGLSGIPSILFGLVGYTLLIYKLGIGRSLLCASISVAAMIVPFVSIRAKKIFEEKRRGYMEESLGLGLSKEYTLRKLILPHCASELLGTVALGMAYGMGAVAPILYTGAVMQADIPRKLTDPFMSLPYHLYMLVNNGFSLEYAFGTAFVLMAFLLLVQLLCKGVTSLQERKESR